MARTILMLEEHVDSPSMSKWPRVAIAMDQIAMVQEMECNLNYGNQSVYRTVVQLISGTHVIVREPLDKVLKAMGGE